MISIKMYEKKWRIQIGTEVWSFEDTKIFKETLDKILNFKEKFGSNVKNEAY